MLIRIFLFKYFMKITILLNVTLEPFRNKFAIYRLVIGILKL